MLKVIPLLIVVAAFVVGCGPKGASQEQLATLAQSKAACDAAESKLKDIEAQKAELQAKITEQQNTIKDLQAEFDALDKNNITPSNKEEEPKETK
jgi:peptidoglycan hydrolase CwlO-like protein